MNIFNTCSFAMSPNCNVSKLFGFFQSYGCPHAAHHQPHMLFCLASMVGGHPPPQEVLHWKQIAMLTDTSERHGSSSFCFSYHMPEEVSVLPHHTVGLEVSRLHVFQHLVLNFSTTVLVHCGMSSFCNQSSLHNLAMPWKASYQTSVIHLRTTTAKSSL